MQTMEEELAEENMEEQLPPPPDMEGIDLIKCRILIPRFQTGGLIRPKYLSAGGDGVLRLF